MTSRAEQCFESVGHPLNNRLQTHALERAVYDVDANVWPSKADVFKEGSLNDLLPSNEEDLTSEFAQLPKPEVDSVEQHLATGGFP